MVRDPAQEPERRHLPLTQEGARTVVALTPAEQQAYEELEADLSFGRGRFDLSDQYYDGAQRLRQLGLAIPPELMAFTVVVNWPRVAVDSYCDRLAVKGFRYADDGGEGDDRLWRLYRQQDVQQQDARAWLDYYVHGRTYCSVSLDVATARPRLRTLSPYDVAVKRDEYTDTVTAALQVHQRTAGGVSAATLWTLDRKLMIVRDGGRGPFTVINADAEASHWRAMGFIPIIPAYRRERTRLRIGERLQGSSLIDDVAPLTDAAARVLTNAQLAQETHAVPARGVLGATRGDFVDQSGKPLPTWEAYFGSVWALGNESAKTFQFDASDMSNFERMLNLYARQASGVTHLPASYYGMPADDAASADAIRSREIGLIKAVERDQATLGAQRAKAMQLAMRIIGGGDVGTVETLWHDAGTPTYASKADAVVKLHATRDAQGRSLLPARMAYEELGWSPERIERALELRETETRDPYLDTAVSDATDAAAVG
jgi:hypothetical protein